MLGQETVCKNAKRMPIEKIYIDDTILIVR